MRFTIFIREDGAGYWSEVSELPGCFATGRTLTGLREALGEAIGLYLWDRPAEIAEPALRVGSVEVTVPEPPGDIHLPERAPDTHPTEKGRGNDAPR